MLDCSMHERQRLLNVRGGSRHHRDMHESGRMTLVRSPSRRRSRVGSISAPEFIAGDDVWKTLRDVARRAKGPKRIAVAYLGDGAGDLIHLGEGDQLLVALTEANCKAGCVSPREVSRLLDRGVDVFVDEDDLHAKVYILGDVLVVGSPNLSKHSATTLHEAVLVSRDAAAVRDAVAWFDERCTNPVSSAWLDVCARAYRPPRRPPRRGSRKSITGRVWLVGVKPMELPDDELQEWEAGEIEAEDEAEDGVGIETLRFLGASLFAREVKRGDLVIQVWKDGRSRRIYSHARVLHVLRTKSGRGAAIAYVYVEERAKPAPISWKAFKSRMAEEGVKLGQDVTTREIRDRGAAQQAKVLVAASRQRSG